MGEPVTSPSRTRFCPSDVAAMLCAPSSSQAKLGIPAKIDRPGLVDEDDSAQKPRVILFSYLRDAMAPQRTTGDRLATPTKKPANANKLPGKNFPVQRSIQKLSEDLDALNERIAELEHDGHQGHAMDVLKANALDFARQIDELRSLLIVLPVKKGQS
jgi:hypothetical protein